MAIMRFRKGKKNPYFLVHNSTISDNRLSNKAKGLLCYIFSKPDNWYVSYQDLVSSSTDGIKSIRATIKELINAGYLKRSQLRNDNGQFGYYDLTVYEKPQIPKYNKNILRPYSPKRHAVRPHTVNSTLTITDKKYNTEKNNNSTVEDSALQTPAADVSFSPEKYKETTDLLNELRITNHKKLFDLFPLADILSYSYWIRERNVRMKNPTGFIITALKEKWKDQEPIDNTKGLRVFFQECTICHKSFAYQHTEETYHVCIKCSKEYS